MRVELINCTPFAMELLLFTKQTRLEMTPDLFDAIFDWPKEKKLEEINYIANTIPSSWEFVDYTFLISGVSRGFTHQFVRNRNGSYAQQSMRVTDQSNFEYYTPPKIASHFDNNSKYEETMDGINDQYHKLIAGGANQEDARGILPTNICTNIIAKYNLRTMSDLAKSRTGGRTQGEFRDVMGLMCDEVIKVHPWAEQFLFQCPRDYFQEIEDCVANFSWDVKTPILKIIDKMRKQA